MHQAHEHYSASNPVPKLNPLDALDRALTAARKDHHKHSAKQLERGKDIPVIDPVTGEHTNIQHAQEPLNKPTGENILDLPWPAPLWSIHYKRVTKLTRSSIFTLSVAYNLSFLFSLLLTDNPTAYLLTLSGSLRTLSTLLIPTLLAYILAFRLGNIAKEDFQDRYWDAERHRGLRAGRDKDGDGSVENNERIKESAEWFNSLIEEVMPIINPDMFKSLVDMIEDVMQGSLPSFIYSVRVSDMSQGSNPFRITSIRSLPDADIDGALGDLPEEDKNRLQGKHINLEVSFVYRAQPSGETARSKAHNAHLLIEFFLGLQSVWGKGIPVWTEVTGVSATARIRLELISNPPFIKTTFVTLMGLPRISISVVAMAKALPNIMDIPLLSSFIASSIDTAVAEYVAPKGITLDLQQLISGDDIKKDTDALGVIIVHIHRAIDLPKQDTMGSTDSYVTIAFSRLGKPLFSTRIIKDETNPMFEETAVVIIDSAILRARESLSLQLWDSDRASADDVQGSVEIDIFDLMRKKNVVSRQSHDVTKGSSKEARGRLEFTIGYFDKLKPNEKFRTDGESPQIPDDLKDYPGLQDSQPTTLSDLEEAVMHCSPDPQYPSGILSIQIHEICDLEVKTEGRETVGSREGEKGQDDGGAHEEQGENLPSSYCTLDLNNDLIYATRVKPLTSFPIFNAGTERFVRDWRTTEICVTVWESRMREKDAVLGVVPLQLGNLLKNASAVTQFYPIENGIGYGRIRVSVLFRPVKLLLPPSLRGFDIATLRVGEIKFRPIATNKDWSKYEMRLRTTGGSQKVSRKVAKQIDDHVKWEIDDDSIELPVMKRYSSAFVIKVRSTGVLGASGRDKGMAVIWLRDIADGETRTVTAVLWQSDDYARLKQNYVELNQELESWEAGSAKASRLGTLEVNLSLTQGISKAHKNLMQHAADSKLRKSWEVWTRLRKAGKGEDGGNTDSDQMDSQMQGSSKEREGNTELAPEKTEEIHVSSGEEEGDPNCSKGGLRQKLSDFKEHQQELNQQHRGIMQTKPARTAEWMRDNVKIGAEKLKNKFDLDARTPTVETEV